jgi:hypothetical protein
MITRAHIAGWSALVGTVGVVGVLGIAGSLTGWVWPLLFLTGAVVAGTLVGRRPWLVVGMVVVTGALLSVPDEVVRYVGTLWMWTAAQVGAAIALATARRWLPGGPAVLWHLALLLPRHERALWRAEIRAVLHACADESEARRQVRGFLAAVPATVLASWRTRG